MLLQKLRRLNNTSVPHQDLALQSLDSLLLVDVLLVLDLLLVVLVVRVEKLRHQLFKKDLESIPSTPARLQEGSTCMLPGTLHLIKQNGR